MVVLLGLAVIGQLARPTAALSYDDLTEEQKAEALQQKQMLTDMFAQLEGLTDEDKKAKVATFNPQQQELLKAYFEHQQQAKQSQAKENARLTPEQQQEMLKELYARLEGKTYGEQEALIKKFTTQEKDLFDRYNDYQKKQQEEFTEKRKKELGHCEADLVYKVETKKGEIDFSKPDLRKCQRVSLWDDELGDDGAAALAKEMIAHADRFVALSLDTTDVEEDGAIKLAEALTACQGMVALDLDSNTVGDTGAQALAEAATAHPSLNTLGLAHNNIGEAGGAALLKMLRRNYAIVTMPLHGNTIPKAMMAEIETLLGKNREAAAAAAQAAQAAQNSSVTTAEEESAELEGIAEIDADSEEYDHDEM
jgi:hypothetical protein